MTTNPLLVGSYATIVALWAVTQVVYIPYVTHLILLVTAILYAACHASLWLREEAPLVAHPDKDAADADASRHSNATAASSDRETLRQEDAYQFPIIGSLSLFGLYLAFKYLDKDLVNLLIGAYFAVVGCLALTATLDPLVVRLAFSDRSSSSADGGSGEARDADKANDDDGQTNQKQVRNRWRRLGGPVFHPLPAWLAGESPWDCTVEYTASQVVALVLAAVICGFYLHSKPWYLNNVLGICFCLQGIERFSMGTYKIGAILLVGLFFYDIFWVFGTEVMVTVARNLDGPIKILFPRGSLVPDPETGKLDLSLLGLGDIVIPGFFLALLLRFDAHQAQQPVDRVDVHAAFAKPYFHTTLVAYVLGLLTTMVVMIQFNAAQPALLYLVPACLGASFGCAVWRGEVSALLAYSEEVEEEEDEATATEETTESKETKKEQ